MKRDKFVLLFSGCAFVISFLAALSITRRPVAGDVWSLFRWALRVPPFFGDDYIPIDDSFVDGVAMVFVLPVVATVSSAFWFFGVRLIQRFLVHVPQTK